ncbi:MAG: F-box protein [Legionella longbeachae]|nr:F-box protein [Legionella longbeachae]
MKEKNFLDLPKAVMREIVENLSTHDLLTFIRTSKTNIGLFKNDTTYLNSLLVERFLQHVVRGEYGIVQSLLALQPDLIDTQGQVTDLSKRKFPNVSGFEYALWALDEHMWTRMLESLSEDEKGSQIKARLYDLLIKYKKNGVTYTLHDETRTEQHFDFKNTIIKELQEFVKNGDNKQWINGVGGKQKLLPIHVIEEYSSSEPFYPIPKFTHQPKSSRQFFNGETGSYEFWFADDSELGVTFAICKTWWDVNGGCYGGEGYMSQANDDLAALESLYKIRKSGFNNLGEKLILDNKLLLNTQIK